MAAAVNPSVTTGPIAYSEKVYQRIAGPGGIEMAVPLRRVNLTTGEQKSFAKSDISGMKVFMNISD